MKHFVQDKTIPQGAATTVWACVAPKVSTDGVRGAYCADCGPILPNPAGQDVDKTMRKKLWETTDQQLDEAVAKAGL